MENVVRLIKTVCGKIRHLLIGHLSFEHEEILRQIDDLRILIGVQHARTVKRDKYKSIRDAEFRIFSQYGDKQKCNVLNKF